MVATEPLSNEVVKEIRNTQRAYFSRGLPFNYLRSKLQVITD